MSFFDQRFVARFQKQKIMFVNLTDVLNSLFFAHDIIKPLYFQMGFIKLMFKVKQVEIYGNVYSAILLMEMETQIRVTWNP